MASPEYLRFYDSTLRLLAARGHAVGVAVMSDKEKKQARLHELDGVPGVEVLGIVPRARTIWSKLGRGVRGTADFVRYLHPGFAQAPALRERMKYKALPRGLRALDRVGHVSPAAVRRTVSTLAACERALPVDAAVLAFLEAWRPDVVAVSPLVDAASPEVEVVKAAQRRGVPVAACIASWDNLTNKGLLRVQPDRVVVWNDAQKREAAEFHYVDADRVAITGAQLFDRWFDRQPSRDRAAFCAMVGLPDERPFILFTGSSGFIANAVVEAAFVRRWIAALRASGSERVRGLSVLVRPHPYNASAWAGEDLSDLPRVGLWPRGAFNAIDEQTRRDYFDSLHFSAAVVGINTSAMIEAAIVGRPVLSIQAEEFSHTQEGTIHFHHLLPQNGGFLRLAGSIPEHVQQLEAVIDAPGQVQAELAGFVRSFVRPFGVDQPGTPRLAGVLEELAAGPRPAPQRTRWFDPALRVALAGAGGMIAAVGSVTDERRAGKMRKRASKAWRRTQKAAQRAVKRSKKALTHG
jgi:hypothetical protein